MTIKYIESYIGGPYWHMTHAEIQFIGNLSGIHWLQLRKHAQEILIIYDRLKDSLTPLSSAHLDLVIIMNLDLFEK